MEFKRTILHMPFQTEVPVIKVKVGAKKQLLMVSTCLKLS